MEYLLILILILIPLIYITVRPLGRVKHKFAVKQCLPNQCIKGEKK